MSDDQWPDSEDDLYDFYVAMGGVHSLDKFDKDVWDFGWTPEEDIPALDKSISYPISFAQVHPELIGTGLGKTRLLYEAARQVFGRDLDIGPQGTGDCVSWGTGGAIDLLACVEVAAGEAESYGWGDRVCTEAIHALARVEYGSGRGTNSIRGSISVRDGGTLSRREQGAYSVKRADKWGKYGLPDDLEPMAGQHRVRDVSLISSFAEASDALFNGLPIVIGSPQGFRRGGRRDEDGFARAGGKWKHCMKFVAVRNDERPGLLCMNSWSPNSGPKGRFDIPDGSFWVEKETCERMFNIGAGYALGRFEGYPRS